MQTAVKPRFAFAATLIMVSWLGYWRVNSRILLQVSEDLRTSSLDEPLSPEDQEFLGNTPNTTTHGQLLFIEEVAPNTTLAPPETTIPPAVTIPKDLTADLPPWLQEYAQWHRQQRARINEHNWKSKRNNYLIVTARRGQQAGGLTDRLKPLPHFLKLAAKTNRILLIYWNKPFSLEHYLLPPDGGLDWRVPFYMVEEIVVKSRITARQEDIRSKAHNKRFQIVATGMQAPDYGQDWYDATPLEGDELPQYNRIAIFRHMWYWAFTPSPPIAQRVKDNFDRLGLVPGEYASAHIRAVYAVKERPEWKYIHMAQHAMNCISMLRPGGPFFVASDTAFVVQEAIKYGRRKNVTVVATTNNGAYQKQPLHLDMYNASDLSLVPEDFYDAFVICTFVGYSMCGTWTW
ncbi:expressed unknown protein [Seminavis robusta]|uniref:Uncharacterized protein n=1 Tax=Seminavis robusta TaxID=568900 RepID=A0A9N8DYU9_9STRA|nr:expressed unknown protein [Seminavis robusta]|eukprot:Sro377_g129930.1 n/a (403) ;mRNA; r:7589-8797